MSVPTWYGEYVPGGGSMLNPAAGRRTLKCMLGCIRRRSKRERNRRGTEEEQKRGGNGNDETGSICLGNEEIGSFWGQRLNGEQPQMFSLIIEPRLILYILPAI